MAIRSRTEDIRPGLRVAFKYANRFFMVPLFRLGLGRFIVSPFSGYILVLKTTGRKSGEARYAPLNYAVIEGDVFLLSGFGGGAHWLANLRADASVELLMPGGAVAGRAEEVTDPELAVKAMLRVVRNSGFALVFEGLNPLTTTDDRLIRQVGGRPVVRVRISGIAPGPHDPGGWGWIPSVLGQVLALRWLAARSRRKRR